VFVADDPKYATRNFCPTKDGLTVALIVVFNGVVPTDDTATDEVELPESYGFALVRYPVVVRFVNVGLLLVAILCGRLNVTAPVLELTLTWLVVPVAEVTYEWLWPVVAYAAFPSVDVR
jgi:hypothetical protein